MDSHPGTFAFTLDDLAERERIVFSHLKRRRLPHLTIFGGGYGPDAHAAFRQALLAHDL
jgi:hypothetical protein